MTSAFDIELTSTAFRINRNGVLEVAASNLDRDPPNPGILTFQVLDGQLSMDACTFSYRVRDNDRNQMGQEPYKYWSEINNRRGRFAGP